MVPDQAFNAVGYVFLESLRNALIGIQPSFGAWVKTGKPPSKLKMVFGINQLSGRRIITDSKATSLHSPRS